MREHVALLAAERISHQPLRPLKASLQKASAADAGAAKILVVDRPWRQSLHASALKAGHLPDRCISFYNRTFFDSSLQNLADCRRPNCHLQSYALTTAQRSRYPL
jgi:hypothetical protein